jgi:hypothetical protein
MKKVFFSLYKHYLKELEYSQVDEILKAIINTILFHRLLCFNQASETFSSTYNLAFVNQVVFFN